MIRSGPAGTVDGADIEGVTVAIVRSVPPGDYLVTAIPDEKAAGWQDRAFLDALSRLETLVTIGDGEHRAHHLRTQEGR